MSHVIRIRFSTQHSKCNQTVLETLNSPDSWGVRVVEGEPAQVIIGIAPRRSFFRVINGEKIYFSATFVHVYPRIILFDPYNYIYGVKRSGLSLNKYRKYLINHEFGHVLGKDHLPCRSGTICPVLYQMTKGVPKHAKPNYKVTVRDKKSKNKF